MENECATGNKPLKVCWVLISMIAYHHARIRAFASLPEFTASVIEITDTDLFRELAYGEKDPAYARFTLFPQASLADLDPGLLEKRLRVCLGQMEPDVVCLNGWSAGGVFPALRWCLEHGVPTVIMSESTRRDASRLWHREMLKKRIIGFSQAALVGGRDQRAYLEQLGMPGERIFQGYNAVDNGHFASGAEAARAKAEEWRKTLSLPDRFFLASGRFVEKKNFTRLIKAHAIYRKKAGEKAWPLVLLGDGELRAEMEQTAAELDMANHLRMPGFQTQDNLPVFYGLAGAFIHPSTVEQWGLVANEAMAAGLPVLVSESCGCAADLVIPGKNGWTFNPWEETAMAAAMEKMADTEPAVRASMGQAGQKIIAGWSPESFAKGLRQAARLAHALGRGKTAWSDRLLLRLLPSR